MRILAIRGARLASLEAPFEVDLTSEPLRSAGVFAITGPTGAGKSSLLDALCLALFGDTPRLARTPGQRFREDDDTGDALSADDPRTLVRDGASDAFAEVDFIGVDGRVHRARWSVTRARRRARGAASAPLAPLRAAPLQTAPLRTAPLRTAPLRTVQCSLLDVASGQLVAGGKREVLAAIEARLGLGFAQLQRSVILPQNEFAAFLEAGSDERATLLERATGAEIFGEVAKVVHERAAGARRAREIAAAGLETLAVLSDADVVVLEAKHRDARIASAQTEERLADLVRRRERLDALRLLRDEERQAIDAERGVEAQLALVERARQDVALFDRLTPLAPLLADDARATDARDRAARALETARAAAIDSRARSARAESDHRAALADLGHARDELERARDRLSRARELEASARVDEAALEGSRAAHAEAAKAFGVWTETALRLGAERERAEAASRDARRALDAEEALAGAGSIEDRFAELELRAAAQGGARAALAAALREADARVASLASCDESDQAPLLAWARALDRAAAAVDHAHAAAREAASERASAESERACADAAQARAAETGAIRSQADVRLGEASRAHERILTALSLEAHRAHLVPGEPCPLCGSPEHPHAGASVASVLEREARARMLEITAELTAARDAHARETARARAHREAADAATARAARWTSEADAGWAELAAVAHEARHSLAAHGPGSEPELLDEVEAWASAAAGAPRDVDLAHVTALAARVRALLEARERSRMLVSEARTARDAARLALAEADGAAALLDAARTEVRSRTAELDASAPQRARERAVLEREQREATKRLVEAGLPLEPPRAERAIDARLGAVTQARAGLLASSREIARCVGSLAEARAELPASRERVETLARAVAALEQRARAAKEDAARLVGAAGSEALSLSLDEALAAASSQAERARDAVVRSEEQLARVEHELAESEACFPAADRTCAEARGAVDRALAGASTDRATAERLLIADRALVATQRRELARLDAERSSARARREDRAARRASHEAEPEHERGEEGEALEAAILRARERRDAARTAEGHTHALLERDRAVRIEAGARREALDAAVSEESRWRALAEVVGAADGKRFRVYAQGLTLDRLLGYANAQLRELAPRYALVRARGAPGSSKIDGLALAVLDREAGETLRSVTSLSGGETFLVSLALALGLSEMTSERAPLGSLFLDEGFGALDPDSLELALSALDTLRASGRQVAIVTHVAAIAERFSARVEVTPSGAGRSAVRVVAA